VLPLSPPQETDEDDNISIPPSPPNEMTESPSLNPSSPSSRHPKYNTTTSNSNNQSDHRSSGDDGHIEMVIASNDNPNYSNRPPSPAQNKHNLSNQS